MIDKTNYKNHLMFLLGCLLGVFGVIAGAGSMNYGVSIGKGFYVFAGIIAIIDAVIIIASFYKKYFKPIGA